MHAYLLALTVSLPIIVGGDKLERFPLNSFAADAFSDRLADIARQALSAHSSAVSWDELPAEVRDRVAQTVQQHAAKLPSEFAVVTGDRILAGNKPHGLGDSKERPQIPGHAAPQSLGSLAQRQKEFQRLFDLAQAGRLSGPPGMADVPAAAFASSAVGAGAAPAAAVGEAAVTRAQPLPILTDVVQSRRLLSDIAAPAPAAALEGASTAGVAAAEPQPVMPGPVPARGPGSVSIRRIPPGAVKTLELETTSTVVAAAGQAHYSAAGAQNDAHSRADAAGAGVAAGGSPGIGRIANSELPAGRGRIVASEQLHEPYTPREGRGLGPIAAALADASARRLQAVAAAAAAARFPASRSFPIGDPRREVPPPPQRAPDEPRDAANDGAAAAESGLEGHADGHRLSAMAAARRALPWADAGFHVKPADFAAMLHESAVAAAAAEEGPGATPAGALGSEASARFLMLSDRGSGATAGGAVLHAASSGGGPGPAAAFNGLYDASTGLSEPTKDCKKNVNTWLGKCVFTGSVAGSAAAGGSGGAGQAMSKDCAKTLNTWLSSCVFKAK